MNIAVFASGKGTNFEAVARAIKRGYIRANLKLLLTDRADAYARIRAKKFGIKEIVVNPKKFNSRLAFDKEAIKILEKEKIGLIILAGFMRLLTPYFVRKFKNKILNIHPAILPAFRGECAIERAFRHGCKITGVTVHFVDEKVDHGPIILQEVVKIDRKAGLKELEEKIHAIEHKLYPLAIKLFVEKKLKLQGRYVKIS
jgi:phosphoribosylglycinamide formyltransferase-1